MKGTFLLALVGFSALTAVGFATAWAYRVTSDLREQVEQRGESLTANLAGEALRVLHIEDSLERELSLMLLTHRLMGEVVYAQIVHQGVVVSESTSEEGLALEPLGSAAAALPVRERTVGGRPVIEFVQLLPGDEDDAAAGASQQSYVRVGLSLEQVQAKVRRSLVDMAALALLFTAVGAAVAYGLYSAILVPLERVIASIRRLQAGDLGARAHISTYPELRELADAFNHMAEEIGRRNEELERVNAELRSANEAKSQFLAMMGHELKTPLHSVRGYCQILLEELGGPLTQEQRSDIQAVLASGNHLLALIDNLLHFSASGTESLHKTAVFLPDLLRQAADYVKPLAQRKGLYVRVETDVSKTIYADGTKLKQVLINLLHNAVKYTDQGGVVASARFAPDGLLIEVCDTGSGIPREQRERIFEPFERIEREGGEEYKGLGLGLAIARGYVLAHGGSIWVEEAPGGGARFCILIPDVPGESAEWEEWSNADLARRGRPSSPPVARQVLDSQGV